MIACDEFGGSGEKKSFIVGVASCRHSSLAKKKKDQPGVSFFLVRCTVNISIVCHIYIFSYCVYVDRKNPLCVHRPKKLFQKPGAKKKNKMFRKIFVPDVFSILR